MSQCYTVSPYLVDFEVGRSFREPQITRAPDHERAELGLRMIRQTGHECTIDLQHRRAVILRRRLDDEVLDDLRWLGARSDELTPLCYEIGDDEFIGRVPRWRD